MKLIGFDKSAYGTRATVLAVLLVASAGYWELWLTRGERLSLAIGASLASALVIVLSSFKRLLVILALEVLGGLAVIGTIRYGMTGKPILPGLGILALISFLLYMLGAHRRGTKQVLENSGVGEHTGSIELKLHSTGEQKNSDEAAKS